MGLQIQTIVYTVVVLSFFICTLSLKVLINAGQANAATGDAGYEDSVRSAEAVAQALGIESDQVLIESTGNALHATCCNFSARV